MSRWAVIRPAARSVAPSANFSRTSAIVPEVSKALAERIRAPGLQPFQFFAPLRYEAVFFVHLRAANLERR